jgi:hypothetical protein
MLGRNDWVNISRCPAPTSNIRTTRHTDRIPHAMASNEPRARLDLGKHGPRYMPHVKNTPTRPLTMFWYMSTSWSLVTSTSSDGGSQRYEWNVSSGRRTMNCEVVSE